MAERLTKGEAKRLVYQELARALKVDLDLIGRLHRNAKTEKDGEVMEQAIHEVARMLDGRTR